uniref:EGF-like domain-containing protein n=1 Tax=Trichuris muris TaxID=70415 RepID=A0A5S6R1J8_TRIMR
MVIFRQSFLSFVFLFVYAGCSKCPHDLFKDEKGWHHLKLPKLKVDYAPATIEKEDELLPCITIMKNSGDSSRTDIVEAAEEICGKLPNGSMYGDVDVSSLKFGGKRLLVGIKILSLVFKSNDQNTLVGVAVKYPNKQKLNFSFVKKDNIVEEVGIKLGIKTSILLSWFVNPVSPVCIIRTEDFTEATTCSIFSSYSEILCASLELENCESGSTSIDDGCVCKEGFAGKFCTEQGTIPIPWYRNRTILEYVGLGVAGIFLLGSLLYILHYKRRRARMLTSCYSERVSCTSEVTRSKRRWRRGLSSAAPGKESTRAKTTGPEDSDMGATLKQFPTIVPGEKLVIKKNKK